MDYLDTSAVAKWYLNERGSEEFAEWVQAADDIHISTLTVVEMRCLLARRGRNDELGPKLEQRLFSTFENDINKGYLRRHLVQDYMLEQALAIIQSLQQIPLRTLDALHLSIAQAIGADSLVTADKQMVAAAEKVGFAVVDFSQGTDCDD